MSAQSAQYDVEYQFYPTEASEPEPEISVTVVVEDPEDAEEVAYEQLTESLGFESVSETRDNWESGRSVHISYHAPPWESFDDLEDYIRGLDGVRSVRYDDPYTGSYGPPRYIIHTNPDSAADVRSELENYYDGLNVRRESGSVVAELTH